MPQLFLLHDCWVCHPQSGLLGISKEFGWTPFWERTGDRMGNTLHTLVPSVRRCLRVVPVPFVLDLLPPSWRSLRKYHILNTPLFSVSPVLWLAKVWFLLCSSEVDFLPFKTWSMLGSFSLSLRSLPCRHVGFYLFNKTKCQHSIC